MPSPIINLAPAGNGSFASGGSTGWIAKAGIFWCSENDTLDTFQTQLLGGSFGETVFDGTSVGFFSHNETGHVSTLMSSGIASAFPGPLNTSGGGLIADYVWGLLLTGGSGGVPQWASDAARTCNGVIFSNKDSGQYVGGIVLTSDTMEAQSGYFNLASGGGNVVVTGVGFQPDLVLILANYPNNNTWQNVMTTLGAYGGHWMHFGAASGSAADEQFCVCEWSDYLAVAPAGCDGVGKFTSGAVSVGINGTVVTHQAELLSMDADGFTLSQSVAPPGNVQMAYLAMREPNGFFKVGVGTQPAAGGLYATTGVGGEPTFVMFATEGKDTENIEAYMQLSLGGSDGVDQSSSFAGSLTPRKSRFSQSQCLQMCEGDETVYATANFDSLNADGFTLDWTVNQGDARLYGWIAGKIETYRVPLVYNLPATDITATSTVFNGQVDVGDVTSDGVSYFFQYWIPPQVYGEENYTTVISVPPGAGLIDVAEYVTGLLSCTDHEYNFGIYKDGCYIIVGGEFFPEPFKTLGCVFPYIPQIYRRVIGTT
jgi:hypothetical protein